jgi:uncharacterized alkaline shock family protein YloU
MQAESKLGRVTVAPEVLLTIIQKTVLSVDGVARLYSTWPENIGKLLGIRSVAEGLAVEVQGDTLVVDVHVVAGAQAQMLQLGRVIQDAIRRAIEDLVGLSVKGVNVHIEDVELEPGPELESR